MGDYPGDGKNENYNEGIFVGYRWTDKQNIKPLFGFGHDFYQLRVLPLLLVYREVLVAHLTRPYY